MAVQPGFATREVLNQPPPFEDVDLFALDEPSSKPLPLMAAFRRRAQAGKPVIFRFYALAKSISTDRVVVTRVER